MKIHTANYKKRMLLLSILGVAGLLYLVILLKLQALAWFQIFPLLAYWGIGIFSVGWALVNLLKLPLNSKVEKVTYALALGYGFNIIEYIILFPLLGKIGLVIGIYVIGGMTLIYNLYISKGCNKNITKSKSNIIVICFIIIILLIQLVLYAATNMSPLLIERNSFYTDLGFWVSNSVSFTKEFPPLNYRAIKGGVYYYHYFSNIQIASASMATGIGCMEFSFGLSFVQSGTLLVFSGYCFLKQLFTSNKIVICGMVMILFSTGNEYLATMPYISHLYTSPFGFDLGVAFGMLCIICLMKQSEQTKLSYQLLFTTSFFFALVVGIKAPISIILLASIGMVCFFWLITKEKNSLKKCFFYGIIILFLFVTIYFFIVNGVNYSDSKTDYFLSQGELNSILSKDSIRFTQESLIDDFGYIIGQIIFLVYYMIECNYMIFVLFIISSIINILLFKKLDAIDIAMFISTIIGILFTRGLKMYGYSQVYFLMATYPYAAAFGLRGLLKFDMILKKHRPLHNRGISGFFKAACIVISISVSIFSFINTAAFSETFKSGMSKLRNYVLSGDANEIDYLTVQDELEKATTYIDSDQRFIGLTSDEYSACLWMRKNLDGDDVILSNLITRVDYNYIIGAISETWYWNYDEDLLNSAVDGSRKALQKLKEKGVSYLVLDKKVGQIQKLKKETQNVYSNDSVEILFIK